MKLNGNLIGLSLSKCICDVLDGRISVKQIDKIVARTRITDEYSLDSVMQSYRQSFWHRDPDRGERIARAMFKAGKIEQPRLHDNYTWPSNDEGHWVEREDQIKLVSH